MAPNKVIIDTDPGVDDVLALLLALSAKHEELEVLLISVTHGNIDAQSCLRNVVATFHTIHKEQQWRKAQGRPPGFDFLRDAPPLVSIGAQEPLEDQLIMADFFHGVDGLGGIHSSHPHLSPPETWRRLFNLPSSASLASIESSGAEQHHDLFRPSALPSHKEILRLLATEPQDTISIIAIGPLTNLALAAAEDPAVFLRAKEVIVMGGAVNVPGNITPLAEFNTHADTIAAARLYALTSPSPSSTMPRPAPLSSSLPPSGAPESSTHPRKSLPDYPAGLPRQLKLTLFPLDVTDEHILHPAQLARVIEPLREAKSPLVEWMAAFMKHAFDKSMEHGATGLSVHDAVCIWYAMHGSQDEGWVVQTGVDLRVESAGQWTRGACIMDRRGRRKVEGVEDVPGDRGSWLNEGKGNRLGICVRTPGAEAFERLLLSRLFGLD